MRQTPVDWDGEIHVGNLTGRSKHFIAVREGSFYLGTSADSTPYAVIELDRDGISWLIEALQRELDLAQVREN